MPTLLDKIEFRQRRVAEIEIYLLRVARGTGSIFLADENVDWRADVGVYWLGGGEEGVEVGEVAGGGAGEEEGTDEGADERGGGFGGRGGGDGDCERVEAGAGDGVDAGFWSGEAVCVGGVDGTETD